ncbi:MAG: hypothetical protein ACE5HF_02910 [Gemmatimonadota bacterium]
MPTGPILLAVVAGPGDSLRAMPMARFEGSGLAPLAFPAPTDETFRARFDSAFLPPAAELPLHAAGRRIGTLVLDTVRTIPRAACPTAAGGRALLATGATLLPLMLATTSRVSSTLPSAGRPAALDQRIRTFGPILAEQLLRAAGETRPFLAQRAGLAALEFEGDAAPAMAATYLINDALDGPPPAGPAVSLFFLARFRPARGYVPVWSILRRYEAGSREIYTYATAMAGPRGRLDFLVLSDGNTRRLAASADAGDDGGNRGIDWVEDGRCPVLDLLRREAP